MHDLQLTQFGGTCSWFSSWPQLTSAESNTKLSQLKIVCTTLILKRIDVNTSTFWLLFVLSCTIWNLSHHTIIHGNLFVFVNRFALSFFVHVIAKNLRSWWCYGQGWASNVTVALCRKFLYSPMRQLTGIPRPKDSTVHCITTLHSAQPNVLWNCWLLVHFTNRVSHLLIQLVIF